MFKKSAALGLVLACIFGSVVGQDTVPPDITAFSFPGTQLGNMVGGVVSFRVTATDGVGVTAVELYKSRVLADTDSAPPWGANVDFNGDATGADYTVEAKAYDAAGNASTSTLTVNKPDSEMGGAGAAVVENGCFFKVWAPNADEVQLVGDFNEVYGNGAPGVDFLTENRGGYWLGFVPGCSAGDRYRYVIDNPGGADNNAGSYWRLDPRARDFDHFFNGRDGDGQKLDFNAGIVVDPKYDWAPFQSPRLKDYLIYQLNMIDTMGYGMHEKHVSQARRHFPMPDYDIAKWRRSGRIRNTGSRKAPEWRLAE